MFKEDSRPALWILDTKQELPDIENQTVYSPLHYGDTIEISFVRGIQGETFINGKRFEYEEKNVFFIPPKYMHTSTFRKGGKNKGDMICALHINLKELAPIINQNNLLMKNNRTLFDLAFRCNNFDEMWSIVQNILDESRPFISRTIDIIRLFEMISVQKPGNEHAVKYSKNTIELIDFVEQNYQSNLSLEKVAQHFGYSKQYFCKWFKTNTGNTFNDFLNAVRINHACDYLTNGYSIEETCEQCGYSDPSYFAKVFKRYRNITPKSYAINKKAGNSHNEI